MGSQGRRPSISKGAHKPEMQRITIWRRLTQIGFFVVTAEWLAIGWLRCPFSVPFVSCASCPLTDCPGRWLLTPFLFIIGLGAVLFGRAFCGWSCPMGLVEDALAKLPKWEWTRGLRFGRADRVLKWLKYPFLALIVAIVLGSNYQTARPYEYVVRTPSVFNLEAIGVAWRLGGGAYQVRTALLIVALVGALVVSRMWCRYLCPLGALLSLFNKFSLFKVHKDENLCRNCAKYPRECVQFTEPGTTDCVVCGDCIQGCPAGAIDLRWRGSKRKPQAREREAADESAAAV